MMKTSLLLATSLGLSSAHNWMLNPASYNANKPATAGPCPPKAAGYEPITIKVGESIPISWSTNHGGNHYVRVAATADELAGTDPVSTVANPGATYDITMDAVGTFVVQWKWSGYQNCFDVIVEAEPVRTPCGGVADCQLVHGRHSSCDTEAAECVCSANYEQNENAICVNPTNEYIVTCGTYCQDAMNWCTGDNKIFNSQAECLGKCAQYPLGSAMTGNAPTSTGNSLHCRFYHLHVEEGLPADHCPHASYGGQDEDHCKGDGTEYIVAAIVNIMADMTAPPSTIQTSLINALATVDLINDLEVMDCAAGEDAYTCVIQFTGADAETRAAALVKAKTALSEHLVASERTIISADVDALSQGEPAFVVIDANSASTAAPVFGAVVALFAALRLL